MSVDIGKGTEIVVVGAAGKIAVWMRNARKMMTLREIVRLRRGEGLVLNHGMPRMLGGVRRVHMHRLSRPIVGVVVRRGKSLDILRLL